MYRQVQIENVLDKISGADAKDFQQWEWMQFCDILAFAYKRARASYEGCLKKCPNCGFSNQKQMRVCRHCGEAT